jgi:hypothetical protein
LAQEYDPGAPDLLIKNYVPEYKHGAGDWSDVTFDHTLDMATGNYRSAAFMEDEEHFSTDAFWIEEDYAGRIAGAFDWPHSAEPGTQWVYHTSDTFILTRAMHNYLQTLEGRDADLFQFVVDEVFVPIKVGPGAHTTLRTSDDNWQGQPYGGYGLWWIPDDIAKIATLLSRDGGQAGGQQILHPDLLADALQQDPDDRGVVIGGRSMYNNGFWAEQHTPQDGYECTFWVPHMLGYSGIVIALLPNGLTYYYASDNREFTWDDALKESDKIRALCGPQVSTGVLSEAEAATLSSIEKVDGYPLYIMQYRGSYDLGLSSSAGDWATSSTGGSASIPGWACSLFAALGDPSNRLYGRNFDWNFSPAVLLFTGPPDGYASVSMVDIAYLGFAGPKAHTVLDLPLEERRELLRAPLWPFDGMNEMGLAVGMAAVPPGGMKSDPGKKTVDSLTVIRLILDRASNVDEAVAILGSYNIAMGGGPPLHYLVADRSGRSALVEFYQGEMVVMHNEMPWHQATNFLRASTGESAAGECWRYDRINAALEAAGGQLSSPGALDLLSQVSQGGTQWSVVYGMSTGQIQVSMGRNYENPRSFQLDLESETAGAFYSPLRSVPLTLVAMCRNTRRRSPAFP